MSRIDFVEVSAARRRLRFALAIAVALVGSLAAGCAGSAFAADAGGGNGGNGGGGNGGNGHEDNRVLVYGLPGNCPPTIACGDRQPPHIVKHRRSDRCDASYAGRSTGACRVGLRD